VARVFALFVALLTAQASAPPSTPAVPVIGIATAQAASAIVRFTPVADAGARYMVSADPAGPTATGASSPLVVRGLTNGTRYRFRVQVTTPAGASAWSTWSNAVTPAARPVPPLNLDTTWVLPSWDGLVSANPEAMAAMATRLKTEIGDGPHARIGLSVFVQLTMSDWTVDTANRAAVRAALASAIAPVDAAIARARPHGLPIGISVITAIRERVDPVQTAAAKEDLRNLQWYQDQQAATGWVTYSQYARKLRRVQEAYVREFGRLIAERMVQYPDILVAVTGDGETEMAADRFRDIIVPADPTQRGWADYSPFAVAEFRDWMRAGGMYAPGQALTGQAYVFAARYAGDASPAVDTNRDGHTFNGDFGTTFSTWQLRHHDWSLTDAETAGAIASAQAMVTPARANGFDAPRPAPARVMETSTPLWRAWLEFRQEMIHRYNRDFARWMTESSDADLGGVPFERWYSAQIPTDLLFGDPPADKGVRWFTSGSAHWTADIWPYGGTGVTSYNVNMGNPPGGPVGGIGADGPYARTTPQVAPRIAARSIRWGIVEWNPSDPWSKGEAVYRDDVELIRRLRPSLLMPYKVNTTHYRVFDSGFAPALKVLMGVLAPAGAGAAPVGVLESPAKEAPLTRGPIPVTGWALDDRAIASVDVVRECVPEELTTVASRCFTMDGRRVVYLGAATRVPGARPDVAAALPTYPEADRAGWGYTLDGTQLPAGADTIRLHVVAVDVDGRRTVLGSATLRKPEGQ
jgi:hypothetical protein